MTRLSVPLAASLRKGGILPALALLIQASLVIASGDAMIRGVVRDERGDPMPGVIVTLTCGSDAPVERVITPPTGLFAFRNLDASGTCTLRAEIPGYATMEAGPIDLRPGKIRQQDLRLIPSGQTTEVIRVEAQGAVVDTESATTSTTLNEEHIEALPIVGRRFQDLLTLAPGVTDTDGDGNVNVHGSRDTGLQVRLDGSDVTDPFTGHMGMNLNLDAIQEIEVITSGASAEYSRADGGFANVVTKSGGNDMEGSFRLFFRTRYLDGDPGQRGSDVFVGSNPVVDFRDLKAAFTLGGPLVKDHVWYFTSVQSFDLQTPVDLGGAGTFITTDKGVQGFAKVTWQAHVDHKLMLQATFDPLESGGLGLGPGIFPESGYGIRTGGLTMSLRWNAIVSPVTLMETAVTRFDEGDDVTPVAGDFEPVSVTIGLERVGNSLSTYARYPCNRVNCFTELGHTNLYQIDVRNNVTSGPFYYDDGDHRVRTSLRSDFTISFEGNSGSHTVKTGFEFKDESYENHSTWNPILTSALRRGSGSRGTSTPLAVRGDQTLQVFDPLFQHYNATGGGMDSYVQETWKPRPNLTIGTGIRADWEEGSSFGKVPFSPRAEARRALHRFDMACDLAGILCTSGRIPGRPSGPLPFAIPIPEGHPLQKFDLDEDGLFESGVDQEGGAIWGQYTRPEERMAENFSIRNINVAPRLALSYDPLNDGKTRLSGTWGRYFDRLFLGIMAGEQYPDSTNYTFLPFSGDQPWITPGDRSRGTSKRSITVLSRDLATPYTQEWSLSVEREIAPEWSVRLGAIGRRGYELLQDLDVNHILCTDYDDVYDVDPRLVCGLGNGLSLDRFGGSSPGAGRNNPPPPYEPPGPIGYTSAPNGVIDLYNVNPNFNQILKIGNYNSSRYRAFEVVVDRRLHRNWQMQASYTRSRARGDAETFYSLAGDDPAYVDKTPGYLDYDQRHVVKLFATTHLRRDVTLGTIVQWASGTPYSKMARLTDLDDVNNSSLRLAYPDGERNDQRNGAAWTIDGRLEKGFVVGHASAEAFLSVENILNEDDVVLSRINVATQGNPLSSYRRRLGRRFELGTSLHF